MKIMITGVCGYIGGSLAVRLCQEGHYIIGCDVESKEYMMQYITEFYYYSYDEVDIADDIDLIIHCAGSNKVGPSFDDPALYYENNVSSTIRFLNHVCGKNIPIIFSSSATVYGNGDKTNICSINETDMLEPLSPYARTKHMIENIIADYGRAYGLKYIIFRHFNVCGAIGKEHGQELDTGHIFPTLMNCIINNKTFTINGDDYPVGDGTCIRDYVHIDTLINVYIAAIEKDTYENKIINLGSNVGLSVYNCLYQVESYHDQLLDVRIGERRVGDVGRLIASSRLLRSTYPGIDTITNLSKVVKSLDTWYNSDNFKSLKIGSKI